MMKRINIGMNNIEITNEINKIVNNISCYIKITDKVSLCELIIYNMEIHEEFK